MEKVGRFFLMTCWLEKLQVADGGRSVPCNGTIVVAEVVTHLNPIMEYECAR